MKFKQVDATTWKEILFNEHYVGKPCMVSATGVTANSEGKKIVKAGMIYPANDKTAKGVLLHDTDVTSGDAPGTIVIHGFVDNAKLVANGVTVTAAAMGALPQITFVGCTTEPTYNPTPSA